jgi:hypothetical protein
MFLRKDVLELFSSIVLLHITVSQRLASIAWDEAEKNPEFVQRSKAGFEDITHGRLKSVSLDEL